MRLVTIKQCKPGMRLAKKIFSEEGVVLLGEQMELTDRLIKRLEASHIYYLYVEDEQTEDVEVKSLISEDTFQFAVKEIKRHFDNMVSHADQPRSIRPSITKPLSSMLTTLLDELLEHKGAMVMLMNMGSIDNYLYQHSLNVCVYSSLLASQQNVSKDDVHTLGLAALLHDVGKTKIKAEILKKNDKLTLKEYEHVKLHTIYGYDILKQEPSIPYAVAKCALQHHERLDGSGYPYGLKGEEISEEAKWIGIVDSYDAMTTNRIYRSPILPHDAIEHLYAGSGQLYDHRMLSEFRDKVVLYPIGIPVKLSNGVSGVVADYHANYPSRPIIRVIKDEDNERLSAPYDLDMSKILNVMITNVNDEVISL